MIVSGEQVVLREATAADGPAVVEIMACPGVEAWWGRFDEDAFGRELDDPASHPFLIEEKGRVIGYIQYYEEADPMYRHAQVDIALHDAHQGRGHGRDAVRALARHLFADAGHHRLTIDPAAANERAIRCYQGVGFRTVGVMRQYERGNDGTWHDGVLMELLADDLP